ncbi:MAG: hypothetical protein LBF71_02845 [Campylobacteraceae bacterium]|jgi:hypothetical protein|nr:hypothetical protein [Campylobacteraceae bacterium]
MRLSAPTKVIFLITLVIAVVTVVAVLASVLGVVTIPIVVQHAFWFITAAYVLLALGVTLKNL